MGDVYKRQLLAESDGPKLRQLFGAFISIHALLAASDVGELFQININTISIHALLAESDKGIPVVFLGDYAFLSTLSLRLSLIHIFGTFRRNPL